jgi:capsular polysaccharide export protein
MKRILFLYANSHQKHLFSFILKNLPSNYQGDLLALKGFAVKNLFSLFSRSLTSRRLDKMAADHMILFSTKRMSVRYPLIKTIYPLVRFIQLIRAQVYYRIFLVYFQTYRPDLVILWSGQALPLAAAVAAARRLSIKLLFCENGYLPHTIVMDPVGVNAHNELASKTREFYDKVVVDKKRLQQLMDDRLQARPLKNKFPGKQADIFEAEQHIQLPEEFVLLALQVFDDSQILLYSPRFLGMPQLVSYCAKEIRRFNSKYNRNLKLVVKEHPSDFGRSNYDKLKAEFGDTIFIKTISSQELIAKSKAVITVNSTVGIEGLFCSKPVITMGEAFYNVPGLVYHLEEKEELAEKIDQALQNEVDHGLIEKFLYYLRFNYLVNLDRRQLDGADPKEACNKIESMLNN